jgi:hypothetical protein
MKIGDASPYCAPSGLLASAEQTQGYARSSLHPGLAYCGPLALEGMASTLNFRVGFTQRGVAATKGDFTAETRRRRGRKILAKKQEIRKMQYRFSQISDEILMVAK